MSLHDVRALLKNRAGELGGVPRKAHIARSPFLRTLRAAQLRYLLLADALPRDHVVWRHLVNQTINESRASELAMRVRREFPDEPPAVLFAIAGGFEHGSEIDLDLWEALERTGSLDIRWVLLWAFRDWILFGANRVHELRELLRRDTAQPSADELLAFVPQATADDVAEFLAAIEQAITSP